MFNKDQHWFKNHLWPIKRISILFSATKKSPFLEAITVAVVPKAGCSDWCLRITASRKVSSLRLNSDNPREILQGRHISLFENPTQGRKGWKMISTQKMTLLPTYPRVWRLSKPISPFHLLPIADLCLKDKHPQTLTSSPDQTTTLGSLLRFYYSQKQNKLKQGDSTHNL